jgi:ATP-dependent helicase/nuclease subunit B
LIAPAPSARVGSRLDSLLAWAATFREIDLAAYREVFPVDPPARGFSWALRLGEKFVALQSALAEVGLRLADVPGAMAKKRGREGDFPEAGRWRQFGELESAYDRKLAARGLLDAQAAKIHAATSPEAFNGIDRVVLLATPDPIPLALEVLGARARTVCVDVVVFAPPGEATSFDGWGRPLAAAWENRILGPPAFEEHVHVCADPSAQADWIAARARDCGSPDGLLGAGVADPEVIPLLEEALDRAGLASFDPEGRPRTGDGLYHLLSALSALAREPSFEAVAALGRCPDFMGYLQARFGPGFSPSRWLAGLDEVLSRHLPATLTAAQAHAAKLGKFPELAAELGAVAELREVLVGGSFAAGATGVPARIFGSRPVDRDRADDEILADSAAAWIEVVRACADAGGDLPIADWWELALRIYGEGRRTGDKPAGALELQGWLELLFEDSPLLAVAGLNDGSVPDAVTGDPFLPEALRERLGLKTNAARFARDAYILEALAACRGDGGRLDLLVGRLSATGDPLRPSRLLLRCADRDLPRRVQFLFREIQAGRPGLPWSRAWRLLPPPAPRLERISVTALRDYLKCPFRFYLRHAVGMGSFDPRKSELDQLDFGVLCHAALEALGREPGLRGCSDAPTLRAFLLEAFDREVRDRYGRELSIPVVIQLESARQRLSRAAEVQAAQRAEGWVIEAVERKFSLRVGDLLVNGKIDRVERHERTGLWRVLDYKTSDTPVSPLEAHSRRALRGAGTGLDLARFAVGGEKRVWTDLQLPLYLDALAGEVGADAVGGYFNLPKAVGETAVSTWEGYDSGWRAAARRCAESAAAAIVAGVFWPPAEVDGDDEPFSGFFHQGTAASVDPVFAREAAAQ